MLRATLVLVALLALALPAAQAADLGTFDSTSVVSAQQPSQPGGKLDVDIDINRDRAWWTSPVWIAIGAIAFIVLVLLIVMAVRGGGGGTTIVKE